MKTELLIRNPASGGDDILMVEDTIAANDDITIKLKSGGSVSIWRGDVHKLVAILYSFLQVQEP